MSSTKKIAPNLFNILNILEKNKVLIATDWVKIPTVRAVFHERKISIKKFRDSYAIPIIEFFISVVKEENRAGNCPIMSKLVHYLVSKGITPREVFDICMGFRGVIIISLLKEENVVKNPIPYMEEVSIIFDANLSGVLDIFTNLYADIQKKVEIAKIQRTKLQQTLKIMNFINTKIIIVQNSRIILGNEPLLKMLGVKNLKELYEKYKNGFEFLSDVNIYENDFRVNLARWIRRVCKNDKPFGCSIYNEAVKKKFSYSGRITSMPDDTQDQYIITFNNISEHMKEEESIQDSLLHDELTGFRNYPTFEKLLSKKIQEAKKTNDRLFLAIADIPELREINDTKGMDRGDMVISEVAEDLRFLVNNNIYLGRLEGSRFGILMHFPSEQTSYSWCVELFKRMNEREYKKTVSITEVDLSESINKLLLRVYDLTEEANISEDNLVVNDFKNIIEYKELPNQEEFIHRLSKYKTIDLSIFYRGLSISADVKIVAIKEKSIRLKLSHKQIKVSKIDKAVYFHLQNIGNIKAYIKDIDENNLTILIDRFRFDKHTPLNRELFRIDVVDDIKAYIEANSKEYDVKVLDINYECVSIFIDRKRNFDVNSLVLLDMLLPINDIAYSCALNATITKVQKVVGGYKMVLLLNTGTESKQLLKQYISKCQMSIIHELSM